MILFRLLLLLYPRSFRARYGSEMRHAFEQLLSRTRQEGTGLSMALLWFRTVVDTVASALVEHVSRRSRQGGEGDSMIKASVIGVGRALKRLRRAPGYAAAFAVTLGLAIGVNSAVFSVVNGVLLQPLPFQDAERILYLKQPIDQLGMDDATFSFMEIDDYRTAARTIDEFVEFGDWEFTVLGEGDPHRAVGGLVTSNYFRVLGMRPAHGRLLLEGDDAEGAEPVMLLTAAYWERTFGGDPAVVGRFLDLENLDVGAGQRFTRTRVVGVLEPGPHYTGRRRPDFYVNYAANDHYQDAAMRDARDHRMTNLFARMVPGASVAAVQGELESITEQFHREFPEAYPPDLGYGIEAVPWQEELTREGRPTFLVLMGTVGMVLLLAAANVTNLSLARLIRREDELATRVALGASRTDLRLHVMAEHAVLGIAGGVLGIVLAYVSRGSLAAYASRFTVRAEEVAVDWTVLGATFGGGLLMAALLAWLPGLPMNQAVPGVAPVRSRMTAGRVRKRIQRGLVVSQLALSFALLAGAGLLVRSLVALTSVDPGFRTEEILTFRTPTGPAGFTLPIGEEPGWEVALHEIRSFPGVRSAAVASWVPLGDVAPTAMRVRRDQEVDSDRASHLAAGNNVSPGYFETLGIPVIAGRPFDETDRDETADVVILNQSMARAHFGDEDPIGRSLLIPPNFQTVFRSASYEVVGIVADSREYGIDEQGIHTFYRPAAKSTWGPSVIVAYQGDPAVLTRHVREVIHRMQPDRAVEDVRTLTSLLDRDVAPSRLNAILFGSFAGLALLIAAVGVLGTLAFSVSQRAREFGIRMALGADRSSVLRDVLGEGALLVALSLVLGALAAVALGQLVSGYLYEVAPVDLPSLAVAAWVLAVVALASALVPALRATGIDPAEALQPD